MQELYYKIGEIAEILGVEQHTLRYLEHTLRLKIKRDERSDRLYTEADLDTLRLIMKLKNEKGLNTTAIRMALNNMEEAQPSAVVPHSDSIANIGVELGQLALVVKSVFEQNQELLAQNRNLLHRIDDLETKINKNNEQRESRISELIQIWRKEQEDRNKSWLSKLTRK